MSVLVFLDTETGGLNPATDSLLSVGLVAYETRTDQVLDEREILVWDDHLNKSPEALAVNQIDLDAHRAAALTREAAVAALADFIHPAWRRAAMVCHNSPFDVGFIRPLLGDQYPKLFHYQTLDTMAVILWLSHVKHLPFNIASLQKACAHFGIPSQGQAHSALADARSCLEVYRCLRKLLVPASRPSSPVSSP